MAVGRVLIRPYVKNSLKRDSCRWARCPEIFLGRKAAGQVSSEITPAILHYETLEQKSVVLLGYSFGACVAPFIASNFTEPMQEILKGVYCFSPDLTGDFEIHLTDMLHIA